MPGSSEGKKRRNRSQTESLGYFRYTFTPTQGKLTFLLHHSLSFPDFPLTFMVESTVPCVLTHIKY